MQWPICTEAVQFQLKILHETPNTRHYLLGTLIAYLNYSDNLTMRGNMRPTILKYLGLIFVAFSHIAVAEDFQFNIPITQHGSGNYYISGGIEKNNDVQFLVDTGAGMVTLTEQTFKSFTGKTRNEPTRRIAVRMADGRTKAVNVYTLEHLVLGNNCDIGPLDVAVIPGASNNILGLDILKKAAPFAIYTSPPSLALSLCAKHVPTIS